ncbi:glycosyltransferase [Proteus mirabilis]|uniref:glycosyltransferase n=1 Tax=Proteus mirabilis TaxID=584 RepID=UPI000F5BCA8F|nr:glycosyltransferase [Proteus mirabilis]ELA7739838.1 glycosyltransferase family 4 protein [Proteus mirabilis]MBC6385502.1 glycosyl transferase [Proteus mirabilis]MBG2905106.1 glycosyltransferase family 4 protein [Proteus mirabilis]MBS3834698.1 glycosyltransferase family 4 protein [Proteus mirabilis]MBS3866608.1 glycosyltransferase family 4 protein [Proteus mirabilis]
MYKKKDNNQYDIVFITNIPAFYKINLFNELSNFISIKVFFISNTSKIRNSDFSNKKMRFKYEFINTGNFENRNKFITLIKLYLKLRKLKYRRIIYPGWEIKELFLLSFITKKKKNALSIESSVLETKIKGIKKLLKNIFLNRMKSAYPSGRLQTEILKKLNFKGNVFITHGVGLINKNINTSAIKNKVPNKPLRYLYIGRLSTEKNLDLLIEVFNKLPNELFVVGTGPQENHLKQIANNNIKLFGYINNENLTTIFDSSDVFILPSKIEPWGLVIEEAINNSLPIIASNMVGCKDDLIQNNGLIFQYNSPIDLINKIKNMENNYNTYYENSKLFSLNEMKIKQIFSYIDSIKYEK